MNILCKLGIHKPDKERFIVTHKKNGKHRWHTNYVVCTRCGRRIASFARHREGGQENAAD